VIVRTYLSKYLVSLMTYPAFAYLPSQQRHFPNTKCLTDIILGTAVSRVPHDFTAFSLYPSLKRRHQNNNNNNKPRLRSTLSPLETDTGLHAVPTAAPSASSIMSESQQSSSTRKRKTITDEIGVSITSSGQSAFSQATKRKVAILDGTRCWNCGASPAQTCHVYEKKDSSVRFQTIAQSKQLTYFFSLRKPYV